MASNVPSHPPSQTHVDMNDSSAALAAELAVGLLPIPDILKRFGKTSAQLKQLLRDPHFRGMVKQFKRDWNEASNAQERIRLKAALMVEENLLQLHTLFNTQDLSPVARMDAFKQMVQLADVAPKKDETAGPKFHLTLNLGDTNDSLTIDANAVYDTDDQAEQESNRD